MSKLPQVLIVAIGATLFSTAATAANATGTTAVLGQGEFRYQYRPEKLRVPDSISTSWQHVHGITLSPNNEILVTYSTDGYQDESTRALARFDLDGTFIEAAGTPDMARGTPHGLDGQQENDAYYLYHSNNAGRVFKTDQDGEIVWSFDAPPSLPSYTSSLAERLQTWVIDTAYSLFSKNLTLLPTTYMPCNVAFHPEQAAFYMADCYGSSYIHKYSTADGSYQALSFGGLGDQPGQFNTPHGLIYDKRNGQLLVADRGNSRLQYLDFDGNPLSEITADDIQQPCDFDLLGNYLLIPDLSGHLLILDGENKVVSRLDVSGKLAEAGVIHPHDAIFLPNHDIVLATWNPGTLTYWKRVKE